MRRIESLRQKMLKSGCDGAVLTSFPSIFYFSGFSSSDAYLFITQESLYIITDSRYTLQANEECKYFTLIDGSCANYDLLKPIAEKENVKTVFFEDEDISVSSFTMLKQALQGREFIPLKNALTEIRRTKSKDEVEKIRESLKLSEYALSNTIDKISPGMSETEVAAILESYMRKEGAVKTSFDTICASGIRSAYPHGTASDKKIMKGNFLTLDFGCVLDGYCSDITRTFVIGNPSEKQKEIYNTVLSAQLAAENFIKTGVLARDVDSVARSIINSKGYGKNFGHSLGHGVGIEIHELPNLSPKSKSVLSDGDIVTVEPGIYIENFGGVRIEDMVCIKDSSAEILTKFPKELIIL